MIKYLVMFSVPLTQFFIGKHNKVERAVLRQLLFNLINVDVFLQMLTKYISGKSVKLLPY